MSCLVFNSNDFLTSSAIFSLVDFSYFFISFSYSKWRSSRNSADASKDGIRGSWLFFSNFLFYIYFTSTSPRAASELRCNWFFVSMSELDSESI